MREAPVVGAEAGKPRRRGPTLAQQEARAGLTLLSPTLVVVL